LALAGFPGLSGFFSKDEIIAATWEQQRILALLLLVTAFLTAYYTFRLYFRVFEGPEVLPEPSSEPGHGHGHAHGSHDHDDAEENASHAHAPHGHADQGHHNHEPFIMIFPLVVLALGALLAGVLAWNHSLSDFLGNSPSLAQSYAVVEQRMGSESVNPIFSGQLDAYRDPGAEEYSHDVHILIMTLSILAALSGIYLAYQLHLKDRTRSERLAAQYPAIVRVLDAKYWVDEVYQQFIVEPLRMLGRALFAIDRFVVDGFINALGFVPQLSGFVIKLTTQRGYLQGYAVTMLFGIAVILLVIFL
jgi:NADH-quinone oxidoreductase subunit L